MEGQAQEAFSDHAVSCRKPVARRDVLDWNSQIVFPDTSIANHNDHDQWRVQKLTLFKAIWFLNHKEINCAIDCGAFYGAWSRAMVNIFKKVIAIEPVRKNYECLEQNVPEATVIQALVARECGTVAANTKLDGRWVTKNYRREWKPQKKHFYPSISIDSLNVPANLIKLDVEGFELDALIGASETIDKNDPVLVVEKNHDERKGILNFFKDINYRMVYKFGPDEIWISRDREKQCLKSLLDTTTRNQSPTTS